MRLIEQKIGSKLGREAPVPDDEFERNAELDYKLNKQFYFFMLPEGYKISFGVP